MTLWWFFLVLPCCALRKSNDVDVDVRSFELRPRGQQKKGSGHSKLSQGRSQKDVRQISSNKYKWQPLGTECVDDGKLSMFVSDEPNSHVCVGSDLQSEGEIQTCGGVQLTGCLLHEKGEFIVGEHSSAPMPDRLISTNDKPICKSLNELQQGSNEFDGPWQLESCSALSLNIEGVTAALNGSRGNIVFMGDSHTRNTFTAFVNGMRQADAFAEFHESASPGYFIEYSIYETGGCVLDSFSIHPPGSTLDSVSKCDPDQTALCVQAFFFWAPEYETMASIIESELMKQISPRMLITHTGGVYNPDLRSQDTFTSALTKYSHESGSKLSSVIFLGWYLGRTPKERYDEIKKFVESGQLRKEVGIHHWKLHHVNETDFWASRQGGKTFHYACGLRHAGHDLQGHDTELSRFGRSATNSDKVVGVVAHEKCDDIPDTGNIRKILTLAKGDP
jgi:hypothetical protein